MKRRRPKEHIYPPPFGEDEDCICSDAWRSTSPRNHSERCEKAYEAKRSERMRAVVKEQPGRAP